ncbi:hypothetical protein ACFW0F_06890 [Brucella anthropi]|uniref:hypothetical protein n=1 Tax=Brucella anthropi TaxID=529 RepID=UPI0036700F6E
MAVDRKRQTKTESLAIRLDPKTRFMLEFISRIKGQTITTVVERAITEHAENVRATMYWPDGNSENVGWRDLWTISEGERALRLAMVREAFPSYEEEKRLEFTREHWEFFYTSKDMLTFQTFYVDVLWPRIDEFIQIGEDNISTDLFAAGKAMRDALKTAGLEAPEWPRQKKPASSGGSIPKRDLSDEIPF